MGANYAEAAYEQWSHLDPAPLLALVRMALVAPDKDPQPLYWGGWTVLAHALGCDMPWPEDEGPDADRLRRNARRTVDRVITKLRTAHAIEWVEGTGRAGRRAEYRLNLTPVDKTHRKPKVHHAQRGPNRDGNTTERGAQNHAQSGAVHHAQRGPEDYRGPTR